MSFGRADLVKIGAYALEFVVDYTVLDTNCDLFMAIQQDVNLAVMQRLGSVGADLALPDGNRATHGEIAMAREPVAKEKAPRQVRH